MGLAIDEGIGGSGIERARAPVVYQGFAAGTWGCPWQWIAEKVRRAERGKRFKWG